MPLIDFWKASPKVVAQLNIEQVVTNAGDGLLRDGSLCAAEFREYISGIGSDHLAKYIDHCLTRSFTQSGMVLQDLVNELGRRLDYTVKDGRYQGVSNAVGFDGIWQSPEGHGIVVEVKTTDAFRMSLDVIDGYRTKLMQNGYLTAPSSVLIVVGRKDTGELEAQVRGSRHAWDIRLISVDALIKLVKIKEDTADPDIDLKIRSLLCPMEYTRLDRIIDVVFAAAQDVEKIVAEEAGAAGIPTEADEDQRRVVPIADEGSGWQFTDARIIQHKRDLIVSAFASGQGAMLIKRSRAEYWTPNHDMRLVCTISKFYAKKGSYAYWYAYHPQWNEFLLNGKSGYLGLGCVDLEVAFVIPVAVMNEIQTSLNATKKQDGQVYRHLHIVRHPDGSYHLLVPKQHTALPLTGYEIQLTH